eukprot:3042937-Alexandrium_andersonii.AAC.1
MLGEAGGFDHSGANPHPGCKLHLKAHEVGLLAAWGVHLLHTVGKTVPRAGLLRLAGESIVKWMQIVRDQPMVVPPDKCQELFDLMHCFLVQSEAAGVHEIPKGHFCIHLVDRTLG